MSKESTTSSTFHMGSGPRHGGPFDRGAADCYYRRGYSPHFFKGATHMSERVDEADMTPAQLLEYKQGWDYQESLNDYKHWGFDERNEDEPDE